jgi:serine/threonine protein kinase
MAPSVEGLCEAIIRSRLMSADEVRKQRERWVRLASNTADAGLFGQWLVANQYLTEYQVAVLSRGHGDRLFIHQYKLLERIGKGRMAGVYRAIHQLGQVVAIKILPPSKAKDPVTLARFQREARLSQRFLHPNLVRTYHTGEDDGLHYLVMEYLEGELLEDTLRRRRRLLVSEAVPLVHQALEGLQFLHEQGMVHRDLKPGNLMLLPGPTPGQPDTTTGSQVKILDIGLGRGLFDEDGPGGGAPVQLTNEGALLGTPDYMAPEQARDPHGVDIRADIYSLGSILYQTLAGQPPFPDDSRVRQIVRHATEAPRPLKELNPTISGELQAIVSRMLAKDPAQRFNTPHQAAQALEGFIAAEDRKKLSPTEPQLSAYLNWLSTSGADQTEALAPQPAAPPKRSAPAPTAIPQAATQPARPQPAPSPVQSAPPARQPSEARASTPPRPAQRPTVASASADVELVAVDPAPVHFQLSRRDLVMLGVGCGVGALAAFTVGALALMLARLK